MPKKTFIRLDEEKKERVMRAAIEEFQSYGFENAKVETIAQTAEVAKGSIYQYFQDKKELFLYSINWTMEQLMKLIDSQTPLKDLDIYEYFLAGNRDRLKLVMQEPLLVSFSIDFSSGKFGSMTEDINKQLKKIGDEYELSLIENGKRKGTVRSDLNDEVLLLFLHGVSEKFNKRVLEISKNFKEEPTEEQMNEMQNLMKNMVLLLKEGMGS